MAGPTTVSIGAGDLRIELSPSVGGAISVFERLEEGASTPILRKCHRPLEKVLDAACFPLVPYVNRIRGGCFTFRGRTVRLQPNMPGDPSPLHGQGWLNPWHVEQSDASSAALSYHHASGEWPWAYEARQEFALDERGLNARLSCRNISQEPMPCGLGFHPYFPCDSRTLLDTVVTDAWTVDEHVLPVAKVPATGRYDLKNRHICGQDLDNGFAGWDGRATITNPGAAVAKVVIRSGEARFFQVYSPPAGGIFVAEPVTHANCALNHPESEWPELGMRVLDPGEEMSLQARFDVIAPENARG